MKFNGNEFMKAIFFTKSKKRTLLIKRKVSQIKNSDNNDNLGESFNEIFDYGDVLSGDDSSMKNDDKDSVEKDEMNEIKKHQYSFF